MLKLRTDIKYVSPEGKLTQAGVEAIQGQIDNVSGAITVADFAAAAVRLSTEGLASPLDTEVATAAWAKAYADSLALTSSAVVTLSGTPPGTVFSGLTGTPSYVELWFNGVSLTSTGNLFVQLGDSAFVTAGYDSGSAFNGSGSLATTGFLIRLSSAVLAFTGNMTLRRTPSTNTWIATHNGFADGLASYITGAGKVTLTGDLTRLRITATAANDFDNSGTVYAVYR